MSDEELEQDDFETADEADGEDDGEELSAAGDSEVDDSDDDDSEDAAPTGKSKAKSKAKAAVEEDMPSVEAKQKERDALAQAMEDFLARGGQVQAIEPNVVADPPKKPDSKYGSRPI